MDQLQKMNEEIAEVREDVAEMKGMMYQVKEAIMGNPVSGDGGLAGRVKKLEEKVELFEKMKWILIGLAASGGFTIGELIDKFIKH